MIGIIFIANVNSDVDIAAREIYRQSVNMLFVENAGQVSNDIAYYSLHPSVVYVLRDGTIYVNGVKIVFGSKPEEIKGSLILPTQVSYFGRNREISGIPTYRRVVLKGIYSNVDAILTADGKGIVEFQFVVHPGGNPQDIRIDVEGGSLRLEDGGLYVAKDGKDIVKISDIKVYQGIEEVEIEARVDGNSVSFEVGGYDREYALIIDPVLTAILASSLDDGAYALSVDDSGNVFVAGVTGNYSDFAPDRIVFGSPGSTTNRSDAFITKLSGDLQEHIATAILASSGWDNARSVAIDASGNVFVAGKTGNPDDFASSRTIFGTSGEDDAFVSKLSNDLQTHIATAILASSEDDQINSVVIDASGNVFVAGATWHYSDFAPDRVIFGMPGGNYDAFVSKLSNDLQVHIATAILTSSYDDYAHSMTIDASGNVFIAGWTGNYSDFAPDRVVLGTPGGNDAFVSKLSSDLQTHIATAILASSDWDDALSVVIDNSGSVFIGGFTENSDDFAPDRTVFGTSGGLDAFVSKLSSDLQTHIATAILASSNTDAAHSIVTDASGNVFVAGWTWHYSDFAPDRVVLGTPGGDYDAFVSKLSGDLQTHIATAILTSSEGDVATSMAIDNYNNVLIAGYTENSGDFAPNRVVFGTQGFKDAFVSSLPSTLDASESSVSQETIAYISGGRLIVKIPKSSYVGYEIYDEAGRLIRRASPGYLPAGRYEYQLSLPSGVYILKVRIGEKVEKIKGVF